MSDLTCTASVQHTLSAGMQGVLPTYWSLGNSRVPLSPDSDVFGLNVLGMPSVSSPQPGVPLPLTGCHWHVLGRVIVSGSVPLFGYFEAQRENVICSGSRSPFTTCVSAELSSRDQERPKTPAASIQWRVALRYVWHSPRGCPLCRAASGLPALKPARRLGREVIAMAQEASALDICDV